MNKSIKRTIAAVSMTAMLAAGFALPVSAATQVEVTGNPVMIRADAGLKNTVVSKAHKGDKYVYVGQKKDSTGRVWYNIKYSGNKTGWITSQADYRHARECQIGRGYQLQETRQNFQGQNLHLPRQQEGFVRQSVVPDSVHLQNQRLGDG